MAIEASDAKVTLINWSVDLTPSGTVTVQADRCIIADSGALVFSVSHPLRPNDFELKQAYALHSWKSVKKL
jgi:hypothetical protein